MRVIVCSMTVVLLALSAQAAPPDPKHLVQARLVADVSQIKPGEPFTVGVLLTIKPKWHVYWKNPGDAGAPTRVQFKLPNGFTVGELSFPIPKQFEQPGDVAGYGYEDEVMLTAMVTPPQKLDSGKTHKLQASAAWLVCEDVCVMGGEELSLELPVAEMAAAANEELFQKWKQRMPQRQPRMTVQPYRGQRDEPVIVTIELDDSPADVQWFIGSSDHFMVGQQQVDNQGTRSTFRFVPEPPVRGSVTFPILMAYTDAQGTRRGVEQEIEIGQVRTGSARQP